MNKDQLIKILNECGFVPAERKLENYLYYTIPNLKKDELVYYEGKTIVYICRGLILKNSIIVVDENLTNNQLSYISGYEPISLNDIDKIRKYLNNLMTQFKQLTTEIKKQTIEKDFKK